MSIGHTRTWGGRATGSLASLLATPALFCTQVAGASEAHAWPTDLSSIYSPRFLEFPDGGRRGQRQVRHASHAQKSKSFYNTEQINELTD